MGEPDSICMYLECTPVEDFALDYGDNGADGFRECVMDDDGLGRHWEGEALTCAAVCDEPSAEECAAFNREPCSAEPHTCGPCLRDGDYHDVSQLGASHTPANNQCTNVCTAGNEIPNGAVGERCEGTWEYECDYQCAFGFTKQGPHVCHATGDFSGGSCIQIECPIFSAGYMNGFPPNAYTDCAN